MEWLAPFYHLSKVFSPRESKNLKEINLFITFYLPLLFVFRCPYSASKELREQLAGAGSLLAPGGSWGWAQTLGLWVSCPYQLCHLIAALERLDGVRTVWLGSCWNHSRCDFGTPGDSLGETRCRKDTVAMQGLTPAPCWRSLLMATTSLQVGT